MIIYNTLKKESRRAKKRCTTLAVKREIRRLRELDAMIWGQKMDKKNEKEFAND